MLESHFYFLFLNSKRVDDNGKKIGKYKWLKKVTNSIQVDAVRLHWRMFSLRVCTSRWKRPQVKFQEYTGRWEEHKTKKRGPLPTFNFQPVTWSERIFITICLMRVTSFLLLIRVGINVTWKVLRSKVNANQLISLGKKSHTDALRAVLSLVFNLAWEGKCPDYFTSLHVFI